MPIPTRAASDRKISAANRDAVRGLARSLATTSIVDILVFFAVLLVGFAYVWRRGDLDWVRAVSRERSVAPGPCRWQRSTPTKSRRLSADASCFDSPLTLALTLKLTPGALPYERTIVRRSAEAEVRRQDHRREPGGASILGSRSRPPGWSKSARTCATSPICGSTS